MTSYQWGEFSDQYKKTEDKSKFYKEIAGEIVRKDADKIKGKENIRIKLGLMQASTLEKAKPFHWSNKENPKHLSVVCADFAKANGSKHPEFDSMLMLERMCKLNPKLDLDNEKSLSLDIKNGLMTVKNNGKVEIENRYVIEEAEIAAKQKAAQEAEAARAQANRVNIVPATPKPAPKVSEKVKPTLSESLETADWNKDVILTFDDSLRNAPGIIRRLESNGIKNYRFYGEAATAMKPEVLADMGIVKNKISTKITPGKWLSEYVDKNRGAMTREQYMREKMMKGADGRGTDYLKNGEELRKYFQEKYPKNWEQKIAETFAYHAAFLHPFPQDTQNHIQYWSPEQIKEDIVTYETFIRAWLNIPNFQVSHLRAPEGGGFGFDKDCGRGWDTGTGNAQKMIDAVSSFRPGATWDNWRVSSHDTTEELQYGKVAHESIAAIGKQDKRPYAPKENLLVLHSNKYPEEELYKIDRLSRSMGDAYLEAHPEKVNSYKVELGASVITDGAWVRSAPEQGKESKGTVISTVPKGARIFVTKIVPGMPEWAEVVWGKNDGDKGFMKLSQLKLDRHEKPAKLPSMSEVKAKMEAIPAHQRHIYTPEDKRFVLSTVSSKPLDKSKDQYLVCIDRGKQYAALVFFNKTSQKYELVGDFGGGVSTGRENVTNDGNPGNDRWATPTGLYDLLPLAQKREKDGSPEWRTPGTGGAGFGSRGSRVFLMGNVDVSSPNKKPLMVALHKTNERNQATLGKSPESHGCIRSTDALIDILDNDHLLDGDYGRYVIVADSSNAKFIGDNKQIAPASIG